MLGFMVGPGAPYIRLQGNNTLSTNFAFNFGTVIS